VYSVSINLKQGQISQVHILFSRHGQSCTTFFQVAWLLMLNAKPLFRTKRQT